MNEPKFTKGPWEIDSIDNDGSYGGAPDAPSGFKSFAVFDKDGKILFDSLNSDACEVAEDIGDDSIYAWDVVAKHNITLAAAAPDLYEALKELRNSFNMTRLLMDEES